MKSKRVVFTYPDWVAKALGTLMPFCENVEVLLSKTTLLIVPSNGDKSLRFIDASILWLGDKSFSFKGKLVWGPEEELPMRGYGSLARCL